MSIHELLFGAAAGVMVVANVLVMAKPGTVMKGRWVVPAVISLAFFIFSAVTIVTEGPTGFVTEHTHGFWGNQVWFDLLLAASAMWFLVVPRAREVGMMLPFWLVLIVATGSIGVMAMLSRLMFLQDRRATPGA